MPTRRPSSRQPLHRAPFPSRPAVAHGTTRWRSRRVSAAGRQGDRGSSVLADRALFLYPAVPLKDMKLLDVKLGQLPSWLAMRDFTPGGIVGAFRRGERGGAVIAALSSALCCACGLKTTNASVSVLCVLALKSQVIPK